MQGRSAELQDAAEKGKLVLKKILLLATTLLMLVVQALAQGPVVIFIGPPGSGKSTQAASAAKRFKVPIISAEQLVEENKAVFEQTERRLTSGMEPETDPILNKFFEKRLSQEKTARGLILDGYPSTKDHTDFLAKMVEAGRFPAPVVVQLAVPDDVARERSKNLPGNTPERIEQRIKDYHREMDYIRVYFPNADIRQVDGGGKPDKVERAVNEILKAHFKR